MVSRPLKDFIAEVKSGGLARTSRFSVEFTPPKVVQSRSSSSQALRTILLYCDSAQLPGLSYSTTQSRTFGEFRELPYEKLYENVNFTFYVDTNMEVKKLFDSWMNGIQSPVTKTFNYYNDYTTRINIDVYDIVENKRYGIELNEAYPKSLGAITLDYSSKDFMKMSVSMMYRNYTTVEYAGVKRTSPFESRELFSINGKLPSAYFNNFNAYQGKFNDFNNQFQNGAQQVPTQNSATETTASIVDFT